LLEEDLALEIFGIILILSKAALLPLDAVILKIFE
jgi:hypothetical protein